MVEEVGKSDDDHRTKNANKHSGLRSDSEEEERPKEAIENVVSRDMQRHPLEHSWTFWFDNPSAKSKQVAWGSSIRPIYTFSTIEEFWRFFVYASLNQIRVPILIYLSISFFKSLTIK